MTHLRGNLLVLKTHSQIEFREKLDSLMAEIMEDSFSRSDLIEGLNRMSSCVYIILCRKLSGYYDRGNHV